MRFGFFTVGVAQVVVQVVTHQLVLALVWGVPLLVALVFRSAHRQPLLRLDPGGVQVRRGLRMRRTPWEEVAQVHVQGRWDESSHLVLTDGTHLPLLGMPTDQATALQSALRRARPEVATPSDGARDRRPPGHRPVRARGAGPLPTPPARPPADFDMDGPFGPGPSSLP